MKGIAMGRKQRGMTLIGFIIGLIVFCFFAYMAMVLGPAYNEYFAVRKAMDFVAGTTSPNNADPGLVSRALDKQFNVGYVDSVSGKQVQILRDKGQPLLTVKYEVRKSFVYNIDFVLTFKYETPFKGTGSGG